MSSDPNNHERVDKKIFVRLLKLSWRYRFGCARAITLQLLLIVSTIAALTLMGLGIDCLRHFLEPETPPPRWPLGLQPPEGWGLLGILGLIALANIGIAGVRYCVSYGYSLAIVRLLQQGIVVDLRARIYEKLQQLSFRFFDSNTSGTLINRVTGDVQSVRLFIDGVIIQGTTILLSLLLYCVYMFALHVPLTLACLLTMPLMWAVAVYFTKKLKVAYRRDRDNFDKMIFDMAERVQGIQVVKGFAREEPELRLLQRDNRAVQDQKQVIFRLVSLFHPLIAMLTNTNIIILLAYGGYLVISGQFPLGTGLIVFHGLLWRFSNQVSTLAGILDNLQQSAAAAQRVFEILDAPVEIRSPPQALRLSKARGSVAFKNVSFEYLPGERVLDNIDFEVKPGEFIGILGTTASGKSTLLSLIPRFYDAKMGAVLLDGQDVRKYDLADLRRQIGLVFQESFLFSSTIAANISFGHPAAARAAIIRAAKIAAADEFIETLPQGYDSVIGEAGCDLSGGQRQRLALARAVLLEPPILLLDDPTAAVDAETEAEIFQGIAGAMQDRTTFMVTQRINVLRRADYVLVMHRGRIIQRGTPAELLKIKGYYRRVALLQWEEEDMPAAAGALATP
ncbi:MAG: ABC transporter ATP-binding protein [Lentisphaerae bacterium]|nr:ABC transporter ATP-binding protein [Lentisphaerota bacterium]